MLTVDKTLSNLSSLVQSLYFFPPFYTTNFSINIRQKKKFNINQNCMKLTGCIIKKTKSLQMSVNADEDSYQRRIETQ